MTAALIFIVIVEVVIGVCNHCADYFERTGYKSDAIKNQYKHIIRGDGEIKYFAPPQKGFYAIYHKIYDLPYHESFPLSATFLSWRVSKWSLFNSIRNLSRILCLAVLFILAFNMSIFSILWLLLLFILIHVLIFTVITMIFKKGNSYLV